MSKPTERPVPSMGPFHAVKVFSATRGSDRNELGDRVTAWLADHDVEIVDIAVSQSSDARFHCLAIVVFYRVVQVR